MDASGDLGFDYDPDLPVPISLVGGRYLLFDVKIATFLRRQHRICGTTIGTLPLSPSQNLFLGVPAEVMPEEAQLLVEKGVAFIVDDPRAHDEALRSNDRARRAADYLARLQKQSKQFEQIRAEEKDASRKRALEKRPPPKKIPVQASATETDQVADEGSSSLFDYDERREAVTSTPVEGGDSALKTTQSASDVRAKVTPESAMAGIYHVTPATSRLLLPTPPSTPKLGVQDLPSSYPLYRHLHERGYFMTPGLRFGCQYTVYPGDPLRFHSHFLAVGTEWDEEIDLMDIVGGGRLGTGVKKGFLLGGADPNGGVRTFSVEWAAM
ncbi:putative tRNA-splicing endonuclease subunit tsp-4 [Exophiala dermatitidis]